VVFLAHFIREQALGQIVKRIQLVDNAREANAPRTSEDSKGIQPCPAKDFQQSLQSLRPSSLTQNTRRPAVSLASKTCTMALSSCIIDAATSSCFYLARSVGAVGATLIEQECFGSFG
jgi:hypothetical protein